MSTVRAELGDDKKFGDAKGSSPQKWHVMFSSEIYIGPLYDIFREGMIRSIACATNLVFE
jgi:hypothetical protein